jgi:hypothetical protein
MSIPALDKTIVVATIAAVASVLAALISAVVLFATGRSAQRAAKRLEEQKGRLSKELASETARLAEISADRNARRDYEYDARKRLYTEIEPLLFQLYESLEEAHYRVRSLARTSRSNNLPGWLSGSGYYLKSTVYKLLVPAVLLRLMQRQMTFVDLRVDETIRLRYQLLKLHSRSFTDDFIFASIKPPLQYDPNNPQWRLLTVTAPATYLRQGLLVGDLESICDAMIVTDINGRSRAMTFSEFVAYVAGPVINASVGEVFSLFSGFSQMGRPILARMLVAQAIMAQLILSTYAQATSVGDLQRRLDSIMHIYGSNEAFVWQNGGLSVDGSVAFEYWKERLKWLHAKGSWVEVDS